MSRIVGFRIEHIVAGPFGLWWREGRQSRGENAAVVAVLADAGEI